MGTTAVNTSASGHRCCLLFVCPEPPHSGSCDIPFVTTVVACWRNPIWQTGPALGPVSVDTDAGQNFVRLDTGPVLVGTDAATLKSACHIGCHQGHSCSESAAICQSPLGGPSATRLCRQAASQAAYSSLTYTLLIIDRYTCPA